MPGLGARFGRRAKNNPHGGPRECIPLKKLLFIFNPHTGGNRLKNNLLQILCAFSAAGYELQVWPTQEMGDARRFARKHAAGADLVVCCGGDGTLNEVVDGMIDLETMPRLGYIPGGTTNDFASSLLLPKSDLIAATRRILNPKKVFKCDVGLFNGRAFTYVAAFGAFTDVSYKTPQKTKNVLGYFAYLLEGMQRLPNLKPSHLRITCEEGEYEDDYLLGMVANSASVAGFGFPGKQRVRLDDGFFEVLLVKHPHSLAQLGELSAALLSGKTNSPLLTILRVKSASFCCGDEVAWTLDGEFGGSMRTAEIEVLHRALSICI